MKDIKSRILSCLEKSPQSLPVKNILQNLRLKEREKKEFFQAMEELKSEGKVKVSKKHRVHLPERSNKMEAAIVSLSRGFAFARPDDEGPDIFIHADKLHGAFVGDRVLLANFQQSPKGPSAEVDTIVEKTARMVTGTLAGTTERMELLPDVAIRYHIPVVRKKPTAFHDGDKVQAKLHRRPHSSELEAEVVKIYGRAGSAKICADAILDQNGIRSDFPKEVLAEAEAAAARGITEQDLKGRLDLRKLSICTIDGPDAKDLDDAVSVSRTHAGYRLGVHIADVSHYIRPNGPLDLEARERGTSVYFADRVVPMLPTALSNGVCSLNAGEDKLTFSALVDLDREGNILSYRFRKSVIRSKVRGVYEEVNQLFDRSAGPSLRQKYAPVIRSLNAARELAAVLKKQFSKLGALDLESTESEFVLNEQGICVDVRPRVSGEAEEMIEYLMITANRAAAMLAKTAGLPFVYRIHEQPNAERVESLVQLVDAAGLDSKPLKHRDGNVTPADFSNILEQSRGTPAQKVIDHQLLRTMAKARYDVKPVGHFGLALEDYCHFTSPIRRYPDTAIHRILSASLETRKVQDLQERFSSFAAEAAKTSSEAEVRAMTAERSAESCYMAEYMSHHIGEVYDGVVSGVTQHGVFVELENSVEGFVPIESFTDADYHFDGNLSQVDLKTGKKLTIGHPLRIRVASSDVASGRIDFARENEEN